MADRLRLLRRERLIVFASVVLAVATAAAYILAGGGTGMSTLGMATRTGPWGALLAGSPDMLGAVVWTPAYAAVIFAMWWLMMVAMMVPSAAPTILLFHSLNPARGTSGALAFMAGYLTVWAGFSLLATALQAGLAAIGLISPMYMTLATPLLGALVLIAAGAYQLTSIKQACLVRCRGPIDALVTHRRTGRFSSFRMGLLHGRYCLGCCWALMALLFVGGVMNIWWIAGVTLYVAAEKLAPGGERLTRPLGLLLIAAGAAMLAGSLGLF